MHPLLVANEWEFRNCHVWDKGIAHIAGNANTKTLRKFPVVTEVCVQYVKKTFFEHGGVRMTMQEWLRYEWIRAGLPLWKTNDATSSKSGGSVPPVPSRKLPEGTWGRFQLYRSVSGGSKGLDVACMAGSGGAGSISRFAARECGTSR